MATRTPSAKVQLSKPVAISRIGRRRQVVIPKEVFDALQLSEGDFLEVSAVAGQLAMKRRRLADDDTLTPAEAVKLRHAMKQVREGKVTPWAQVKNELDL